MTTIDWHRLTKSLQSYTDRGFNYVEAPWVVPSYVTEITRAPSIEQIAHIGSQGDFVGSAEQSFLWMLMCNSLPDGRHVALTPCLRHEPVYDELHHLTFMKVELIHVNPEKSQIKSVVEELTQIAYDVMTQFVTDTDVLEIVTTDAGYDIELNGIEVGSYGYRESGALSWVYATGLAEPRFSQALASSQSS